MGNSGIIIENYKTLCFKRKIRHSTHFISKPKGEMLFNSFYKRLSLEFGIIIVIHGKTATSHINFSNRNIQVFNSEIYIVNFILRMVRLYDFSFGPILILKSSYK
jgi:hypothetical protein